MVMGLTSVAATYRTASVPLTLSGGTGAAPFQSTDTAKQIRWPVRIATATHRWRLHVRNYSDRASIAYTGALAVGGIFFGKQAVPASGVLAGAWAAQPTQVQGAFSTAADGSEWVSSWITDAAVQLQPYAEHMISLGYTCAAQTNQQGLGGCWTSAVPEDAGVLAPSRALDQQQYSPLDVWIEVEVDSHVPVGFFLGDSLTAGTGAALPVRDSYANRWALANGSIAQIAAHHGSTLDEWNAAREWKWQKFSALSKPDFAYIALGANDIFNGEALATVQARKQTIDGILRANFTSTFYLSTLLPRTGGATTGGKEAVRVAYNDWLGNLPGDAVQLFDLAAAIESTTGTIAARYANADGVHLNTAGYARNARAITASLGSKVGLLPIVLPDVSVGGYTRRFTSRAIGANVGDVVTSWPDPTSGTALTTADATMAVANAPTLVAGSGKTPASVRFTRASSQALGQSLSRVSPHTIVTVARWWTVPSGLEALTSSGSSTTVLNFQGGTSATFRTNAGSSIEVLQEPGTAWHVFASVFAGASSISRMDNMETAGNAGNALSSALTVGAWGTTYSNIDVVDIFYYPFALTSAQLSTVVGELKTMYGI